eukprot:12166203-Ditylum_brightwellii.AAC.1
MKDLLPFQCIVKDIIGQFHLQEGDTVIKLRVWEDNSSALILGNMEPGRFTHCSKHFGIKYHWFCGKLKPNNILLWKVATKKTPSNILTKRHLAERNMLMGF